MRRKNFKIEFNGKTVIKHAFNSSVRETERLIRQISNEEQSGYILIGKTFDKVNLNGSRIWKGENGNVVKFVITREN